MAASTGDTALWLHNKLGSTDDLWSGGSICSQLTREKLLSIQDCFPTLQPYVKVKLMLAFLHLPKRNVEEVGRSCQPLQGSCKKSLQLTLHTAFPALVAVKELEEDCTEHLVSY